MAQQQQYDSTRIDALLALNGLVHRGATIYVLTKWASYAGNGRIYGLYVAYASEIHDISPHAARILGLKVKENAGISPGVYVQGVTQQGLVMDLSRALYSDSTSLNYRPL